MLYRTIMSKVLSFWGIILTVTHYPNWEGEKMGQGKKGWSAATLPAVVHLQFITTLKIGADCRQLCQYKLTKPNKTYPTSPRGITYYTKVKLSIWWPTYGNTTVAPPIWLSPTLPDLLVFSVWFNATGTESAVQSCRSFTYGTPFWSQLIH